MTDFAGFAGLDKEYTGIIESWEAKLRVEFAAVLVWWNELCRRLDNKERTVSRVHWPSGPCSHPRMIALFREFYFLVDELNVKRSLADSDVKPDEIDWGADAPEDETSGPISPRELLLDMMESYAPDLWEHFRLFVYIPVGEDQDLEVC
jgi:hypothetical protein